MSNDLRLLSAAILLVAAVLLGGSIALAQEGEFGKVAGQVIGTDPDDEGNFRRVYIQDDRFSGGVLVADDETGKELLAHIDTQVEAEGYLDSPDGTEPSPIFVLVIRVTDYKLLKTRDPGTDVDPD